MLAELPQAEQQGPEVGIGIHTIAVGMFGIVVTPLGIARDQLFQHLLDKPGFSWERDGEALLRKHKPWCFGAKPHPPVTPLGSELAEALPSSR